MPRRMESDNPEYEFVVPVRSGKAESTSDSPETEIKNNFDATVFYSNVPDLTGSSVYQVNTVIEDTKLKLVFCLDTNINSSQRMTAVEKQRILSRIHLVYVIDEALENIGGEFLDRFKEDVLRESRDLRSVLDYIYTLKCIYSVQGTHPASFTVHGTMTNDEFLTREFWEVPNDYSVFNVKDPSPLPDYGV